MCTRESNQVTNMRNKALMYDRLKSEKMDVKKEDINMGKELGGG